ncbi:TPA: response regulator transcription factor [Streptococcus suis]|uniref:response regulator transcription factor n=1 Tax=Streptococcus suis TaxID=1307 RepID=UPI000492B0DC|nr:response regulator transcription factor [Streptococcus suis]MCK3900262.1 response regulator transcription factor [Streptococcus suis]MCK3912885.1 response regulator transcription factor [Streptococcus suis]MCK3947240.1 response regulator transcription factor [Streptococcus suis]MCK4001293.1 response regulator transcription factor [Streptococcus suis]MCK4055306.1 response regulator transcription factor [Streptococcus suis]
MKVLLIDDHTLFSQSLSLALKQFRTNMDIVVINQESELKKINDFSIYDVVLLDIHLEKSFSSDGFEIAEYLLNRFSHVKIIMLTGFDLPVYEYKAEQLGIEGFVNKNIEAEALLEVIDSVRIGRTFYSKGAEFHDELTDREKEILFYLGEGIKRKDIATKLFISDRTLTNHIQSILEKLEVDSTIRAIIKAQKMGYIK